MSVATNALATLDEVKDFYGMTGSKQTDDDLIEDLINRITQLFQTYCGVASFKATNYTEYLDGEGSKYIFPKNAPIISVSNLWDDTDWAWASDSLIASTDYRVIDNKYIVYKDSLFATGDQNIKLSYRAGYEAIPLDLKQACIQEVTIRYKHRRDIDILTKSLEDGDASYSESAFLASTLETLYKYRTMWVQ